MDTEKLSEDIILRKFSMNENILDFFSFIIASELQSTLHGVTPEESFRGRMNESHVEI